MLNRKELKSRGKVAFKKNYWACVAAAFLLANVVNLMSSFEFKTSIRYENGIEYMENYLTIYNIPLLEIGVIHVACAIFLSVLVTALLINVLEVGGRAFFSKNVYETADFKEMFYGFDKRWYKNIVITQFVCNLKIFLWGLLFVIPGIIKALEYWMVPYILAETPNMEYKEVLKKSKQMMNGYKMDVLIFEFSFILWNILSAFTFGILAVMYVNPYIYASSAEIYHALKQKNETNNENMNESSQLIHMEEV